MNQPYWVIERHVNAELRYWDGRRLDNAGFDPRITEAVRFANRDSAMVVLSWQLAATGTVVEHLDIQPSGGARMASAQEPSVTLTKQDVENLRADCLGTYAGGHHSDGHLEAFQHGMETVCNHLDSWIPTPTPQPKGDDSAPAPDQAPKENA